MPEMDGFEATRQLRARGDRVRIVSLTASAMDDERARCFAVGMDDFLAKPLTVASLRDALRRAALAALAAQRSTGPRESHCYRVALRRDWRRRKTRAVPILLCKESL